MTAPSKWRPFRLTPDGRALFRGLAPAGHVLVGAIPAEETTAGGVYLPSRAAEQTYLADVLDVGAGCPGVEVGARVLVQRFSGAGGIDPAELGPVGAGVAERYAAIQIVRCGNAVRAQGDGLDEKLVGVATIVAGLREIVKSGAACSPADPKGDAPRRDLARLEPLLVEILRRRKGRAHTRALVAAGLRTGDDGAAFDGVLAVVDG